MADGARAKRLRLEDVPAEAWDRLAADSFFVSRGFLELWRLKRGRPVVWRIEEAGRIVAALPGVEYGFGPITRFISLPDGCYGGVRVEPDRATSLPEFSRILFDAVARHGYAKTCIFDYYGTASAHEAYSAEVGCTRLADISGPDWAPADAKLRSQIRKAVREGIRVERFDWDRHHRGFLELVAGSARHHHQRPRYSMRFYRALARLAERDHRVRWAYCMHAGRPAASHIYFIERDTLQAWQSHFDRASSFLKPNPFIRHMLCRRVAGEGVRWLNLGSTPDHADGLAYYKARWGGTTVRYVRWTRWGGLGALFRPRG